MKQFEITGIKDKLKSESLANLFNVYNEAKLGPNYKTYSINRTVNFIGYENAPSHSVTKYVINENDSWTSIAYRFYGSEGLWWIVCKVNGVIDPTISPVSGTTINIFKQEYINTILTQIRES